MKKVIERGILYFIIWTVIRYIFGAIFKENLVFIEVLSSAFVWTILYSIVMIIFFDKDE